MNILSLFDGISCARLALDRAHIVVDWCGTSEIDKYALHVAQVHYPSNKQLGDVTDIRKSQLPTVDLLIGGSPCQGFSKSGNRLNFGDPRSKLFFEFIRLLDLCAPKYFLLENVRMKHEWRDTISQYVGVEPIMINSRLVSAQNRPRYYWTNIPNINQPPDRNIKLSDILESGTTWLDKAYTIPVSYNFGAGDPHTVLQKLQNGIYPNQWERRRMAMDNGLPRKLTPLECERAQTIPDNYTNVGLSKSRRYILLGNAFTVDVIAHILRSV